MYRSVEDITRNSVRDFIAENNHKYIKLLQDVMFFLGRLKNELSTNEIVRFYSRLDSNKNPSEFKNIDKIADKLKLWFAKNNDIVSILDLHDVIATSVVVYYESDIPILINNIKKYCNMHSLDIEKYESGNIIRILTSYGYHARHIIFKSTNPILKHFRCELQIKTVLHDAWQIKTHDLIYKPQGELDEKHKYIMESFGDSIQAIEIQSQTIKNIITQDWQHNEDLRYLARSFIHHWVIDKKRWFKDNNTKHNYGLIFNKIYSNRSDIRNCNPTDEIILEITNEISELRKKDEGYVAAWPLMVYMASIRELNDLNHIAKAYLNEWLSLNSNENLRTFYSSFVNYVVNERGQAIEEIMLYLSNIEKNTKISKILKYNLLYYLIEEASCFPKKTNQLKKICDGIMEEFNADGWINIDKANIKDTIAYYSIVFGENLEKIEEGIRLCQRARTKNAVRMHFLRVHEIIGWRRYVTFGRNLL